LVWQDRYFLYRLNSSLKFQGCSFQKPPALAQMATGTESPLVLPTVSLALRCTWRRPQTAMCTARRGATHAHDLARCRRWPTTPLNVAWACQRARIIVSTASAQSTLAEFHYARRHGRWRPKSIHYVLSCNEMTLGVAAAPSIVRDLGSDEARLTSTKIPYTPYLGC
jgi:hypothetical protein